MRMIIIAGALAITTGSAAAQWGSDQIGGGKGTARPKPPPTAAWDYRLPGAPPPPLDADVGMTYVEIGGEVKQVPKWLAVELLKRELAKQR